MYLSEDYSRRLGSGLDRAVGHAMELPAYGIGDPMAVGRAPAKTAHFSLDAS